jgi:hypothetical protein
MADVERERVTALWREAAAAVEPPRCTCTEDESSDGSATYEDDPHCPTHGWCSWRAECGRLREQLDALHQALAAVGLPESAGVEGLIRHHRNNSAFAAGFESAAEVSGLREQLDVAHAGWDGWQENALGLEDRVSALMGALDAAVEALDACPPGSEWWYDGRDIFHRPDGTNMQQIVIPLPETWHESQRVPDSVARLVVEAVNYVFCARAALEAGR